MATFLVVFASILCCSRSITPELKNRRAEPQSIVVPVGCLEVGKEHALKFLVSNRSGERVSIVGYHTSCGCLTYRDDVTVVEPNSKRLATCVIDVRNTGPISQTLWLHTDSTELGRLRYEFSGISTGGWVDRKVLNFGDVDPVAKKVLLFTVFIAGSPEARIDAIQCSESRFRFSWTRLSSAKLVALENDKFGIKQAMIAGDASGWTVMAAWEPESGITGPRSAIVTIQSRSAGIAEIPLYYTTNCVRLLPGKLVFSKVTVGKAQTLDVHLAFPDNQLVPAASEIELITDFDAVQAVTKRTAKDLHIVCTVCLTAALTQPIFEGWIVGVRDGTEIFRLPYIIVAGRE